MNGDTAMAAVPRRPRLRTALQILLRKLENVGRGATQGEWVADDPLHPGRTLRIWEDGGGPHVNCVEGCDDAAIATYLRHANGDDLKLAGRVPLETSRGAEEGQKDKTQQTQAPGGAPPLHGDEDTNTAVAPTMCLGGGEPVAREPGASDGAAPAAAADWPRWIPLGGGGEPPPHPSHLLADWQGPFVEEVSRQLQVAAGFVAMCVLSALSAVCQRRFLISPFDGWKQPAILWTLAMLPSGNRKTSAFDYALAPVVAFVNARQKALAMTINKEQAELRVLRGRLEAAEKSAKAAAPVDVAAEMELVRERTEDVESFRRRMTLAPQFHHSEASAERVEQIAAKYGRAALLADEAGLLGLIAGRYGGGPPNLDPFIHGYEGKTINVGRTEKADGGGGDRFAPCAHVTVGLAPQPDVALPLLRSNDAFAATGFLWRFLFCLPRSTVGSRKTRPLSASREVIDEYAAKLTEMLEMPEPAPGCSEEEIPVLCATAEAAEELRCFMDAIEPRLDPDSGDLADLGSWGSKLAGQILRLAGLLHASDHRRAPWDTPLSAETMRRAIAFAPYFVAHAKAARFEMGVDPQTKRAVRALRWLRHRAKKGVFTFTRSEAHKGIAKNEEVTAVDPVLALLARHGAIRRVQAAKGTGGRPKDQCFEVRPDIAEVSDGE